MFEIAVQVTNNLKEEARRFFFPQVLEIVWQYLERRVTFRQDTPIEENTCAAPFGRQLQLAPFTL